MNKINLTQKLALFSDYWQPHIIGELNGQLVKLVKFRGPFTWHHHEHEDELFMVVQGRFRMEFSDLGVGSGADRKSAVEGEKVNHQRELWIEEGEMIIIPRGTEHCPVADEECHVLLFEPASTLNTGNVENYLTAKNLKRI
jgi:mannose-6-phosphate isomerase-like protein (cupin superfamily)